MKTAVNDQVVLLTKKGLKDLKKTISQLERERQQILQNLRDSDKKLDHDGRLNHTEQVANLTSLEEEINEKRQMLAIAKVLPSKQNAFQVVIGSVVDLLDEHGVIKRFRVVTSFEADPSAGLISDLSPLGQSLLGRNVRDIVEWRCGKSISRWKLLRIA